MFQRNENFCSLRKSVITPKIAAAQMWKSRGSFCGLHTRKILHFLLQSLTGNIYWRFLYARNHVTDLARITGLPPILVLKCSHYHYVLEGLNRVSQTLSNLLGVTLSEKHGDYKSRLVWFGLSTVYLTSLQPIEEESPSHHRDIEIMYKNITPSSSCLYHRFVQSA